MSKNMINDIKKSTRDTAMMKAIAMIAYRFQEKSNIAIGMKELLEKREDPSIVAEKMVALEEAAIYGFILTKFQDETFLQELKEYIEQEVG